ncbi:MAG: hypothetical protein HS111_17585 [Kofleriaceae bacterium]|nr:hypothetical protein [Kofleriaceae bacterium]
MALAHQVPAAMRVFEARLVPEIDARGPASLRLPGGAADEVKQTLRVELLVGDPVAKIADYGGRGELAAWRAGDGDAQGALRRCVGTAARRASTSSCSSTGPTPRRGRPATTSRPRTPPSEARGGRGPGRARGAPAQPAAPASSSTA